MRGPILLGVRELPPSPKELLCLPALPASQPACLLACWVPQPSPVVSIAHLCQHPHLPLPCAPPPPCSTDTGPVPFHFLEGRQADVAMMFQSFKAKDDTVKVWRCLLLRSVNPKQAQP